MFTVYMNFLSTVVAFIILSFSILFGIDYL